MRLVYILQEKMVNDVYRYDLQSRINSDGARLYSIVLDI